MNKRVAERYMRFLGIIVLALCAGWMDNAWSASQLEVGLEDTFLNIVNDDAFDSATKTVTLENNGSIKSTYATAAYTVADGSTLNIGNFNLIIESTTSSTKSSMLELASNTNTLNIDKNGTISVGLRGTLAAGGIINNSGTINLTSNGAIRQSDFWDTKIYNSGSIILEGTSYLRMTGTAIDVVINTGTITFADTTTDYRRNNPDGQQVVGAIDNAGGIIEIAWDHSKRDFLIGDLKKADAGTVVFTSGAVTAATGFSDTSFAAGTFKFVDGQTTTAGGAFDVGSANIEFAGTGNSLGDTVTANTIFITGTTEFTVNTRADGNLDIQADTDYDALFSGYDIAVSNSSTLTLGASAAITMSTGKTIEIGAGSSIAGSGTIAFSDGSSVSLGAGASIAASTIDLTSLSPDGLAVSLEGAVADWVGTTLFSNTDLGTNDTSVISAGRHVLAINGSDVDITGYLTSADLLAPLLPDAMSDNITNGFVLMDAIEADVSVAQNLREAMNDDLILIEGWLKSPASYGRGLRAQRQRQGEYGNAARETLSTTTAFFNKRLLRRFDTNIDIYFGLNAFTAAAPAHSGDAYASLSGRQARSRNGGYDYCPSTTTIWADFHGGWAKQKAKSNINGYDYDGYGVSLGAERRVDRFLLGVAAGYTRAGVDVDDLSTDYDADVMNLGLYAGYLHESGFFARASLGFAHAWNDYDVSMALGPNKKGDFDSQAYTANLDLGYVFSTPAVNLIPSIGLHYTHIRQDGWRESGGRVGTTGFFEKERYNSVDVPVALRVNRVFDTGCVKIAPEARVAWIYAAKKNRSEINYGLQGTGHTATMYGVNPGRNRFQVGAGVKAQWNNRYEASLDYDYEFRSKYHNHNLSVNVGVAF